MFDIGFSELLVIGVIALIFVGPERLPEMVRTALGYIRQIKSSFFHIRNEVERELELDHIKKDLSNSKNDINNMIGYDDLHQSLDELRETSGTLSDNKENDPDNTDDLSTDTEKSPALDTDVDNKTLERDREELSQDTYPPFPPPESESETGIELDELTTVRSDSEDTLNNNSTDIDTDRKVKVPVKTTSVSD